MWPARTIKLPPNNNAEHRIPSRRCGAGVGPDEFALTSETPCLTPPPARGHLAGGREENEAPRDTPAPFRSGPIGVKPEVLEINGGVVMEEVSMHSISVPDGVLEGSKRRNYQRMNQRLRQLEKILEGLSKGEDPRAEQIIVRYALKWLRFKGLISETQFNVINARMSRGPL